MASLPDTSSDQFGRACQLIVYQKGNLSGLDLSQLRIKFSVKRSDVQTPNTADIRVYNLSAETALSIFLNLSPDYNSSNPIRGRVRVGRQPVQHDQDQDSADQYTSDAVSRLDDSRPRGSGETLPQRVITDFLPRDGADERCHLGFLQTKNAHADNAFLR